MEEKPQKPLLNNLLTIEQISQIEAKKVININIGILGHVDSGKTSLAKSLSQVRSTASMDKNPQSQERGITLDLGFSSFFTQIPEHLKPQADQLKKEYLQFTFVDCPGHASLIKTIIGGASIIDIMFLVIDINKGIQTQTAECIVIGELLIPKTIIVLNKIDMIPEEQREKIVEKKILALEKVFSKTQLKNISMVPISANIGASETSSDSLGLQLLLDRLLNIIDIPQRSDKGQFYYLIDHCFSIKGQGSVVTGTVIEGMIKIGDEIEFPLINQKRKVKSIQMFKKPIDMAKQGDRVGLLFTQLDKRGIACQPGLTKTIEACIIDFNKVKYFKMPIKSKTKFHITTGHSTIMGILYLFSKNKEINEEIKQLELNQKQQKFGSFDYNQEYELIDTFIEQEEKLIQKQQQQQQQIEEQKLNEIKKDNQQKNYYGLIVFEQPLISSLDSLIIGSRFDQDITQNVCRLAFYGNILDTISLKNQVDIKKLKIYKEKIRRGQIDRIIDNYQLIARNLFKKQTNIDAFLNYEIIVIDTKAIGKILTGFGQSGKVKINFPNGILSQQITNQLENQDQIQDELAKLRYTNIEMKYKKYYLRKNLK